MRGGRGFLLVTVLMLTSLLLVAGLALLSKESTSYPEGEQAALAAQARELSLSGLEEALAKLEQDIDFPPPHAEDQVEFCWTERLADLTGAEVGAYTVTVDSRRAGAPDFVILIRSTGRVGPAEAPHAQRTVVAELKLPQSADDEFRLVSFLEI